MRESHLPPQFRADGVLGLGAAVLLLLAIALGFFPGQTSVPPIDRDEPRYTQATKQMLESDDLVRIKFQEAPRHKKPIGIHWLQAAAASASGLGADAPLAIYRLPSLLGAFAALFLTVWAARALLPMPLALTAAALFGATIILGVEARLAKTDAVLLATIIAAQGALARVWLAQTKTLLMPLVFWAALGLGILVKGPIAPMVCGLTIAALAVLDWRRLLGKLRPLIGLFVVAGICLPWYVAIYRATDGAFFSAALGTDFLGKAASGQEGHGAPPFVHLAFFLAVGWPLAPFALAAVWRGVRARGAAFVFAAAWALPSWVVFELTPTKLPHYTLPLLPAIAILTVAALAHAEPPKRLRQLAGVLIGVAPLAILVAGPIIAYQLAHLTETTAGLVNLTPLAAAGAIVALGFVAALVAAVRLWRGANMLGRGVIVPTVVAAVLSQGAVWGLGLPALQPVWVSSRLVAAAQAVAPCDAPRLASVGGYNEPSMIFLAGTDTALVSAETAVALAAADGACVVVAARERTVPDLEMAAAAANATLKPQRVVEGFNISKGDPVRLTIFTLE